jgi:hypothetical protein
MVECNDMGFHSDFPVERIWHGEVVPWFPFLTAMGDPGDTVALLHEMAVIGIPMVLAMVGIWAAASMR